jgi:hypothetical protein
MSLFLVLIVAFFEIKKRELIIPVKVKALIQRFRKADKKEDSFKETTQTREETPAVPTVSDGLI